MKRLLAALTLALLVGLLTLALSGIAGATHNDKTTPPHDFTTGGGTIFQGTPAEQHFAYSAQQEDDPSTPSTCDAKGHMSYKAESGLELKGQVTELVVVIDRAFLIAEIEKSSNPALEGRFAWFDVRDGDAPDGAGDQFVLEAITTARPCFGPILAFPLTSGNIVVHDGQPQSPGPNAAEAEAPAEEEALKQREALGIDTEALKKELSEGAASSKEVEPTTKVVEPTTKEQEQQ